MADAVLTPLTRTFTVAWITALALERAAAKAMFDEIYDDKPADFHKSEGDINVYSWGRVGKHNVVVVSLPSGEYGIASAATVAQALRSSLPHIKIGLLVGIGAGIPGEKQVTGGSTISLRDIRLGDVVVSNPDNTNGGVIQFDLVKAKEVRGEYRLERKGFLNSPPMALRTALSELQSRHEMEYSKIPTLIADAFRKFPRMSRMYSHPGLADGADRCKDIYYAQNGEQIERDPRETPEIFYGTIASGNLLEKSAEHRELMLSWLQVEDIHPLCIEMEAAGLMNTFPCLVIRGICDYADSHKNDEWQRYSALTAAGFAKEFLECVEPSAVENTPELHEVLGQRMYYPTCAEENLH
jgi:nucleoside phosphorylase